MAQTEIVVGFQLVCARLPMRHGTWAEAGFAPTSPPTVALSALCYPESVSSPCQGNHDRSSGDETLASLLRAFPDLVLRVNRDGAVLAHVAGPLPAGAPTPPADLEGLVGGGEAARVQAMLRSAARSTGPGAELQLTFGPGSRSYELRLVPVGADEVLVILRDYHERAGLERRRGEFLNRAAHDLRTPLTTVLLMVDLIRGGGSQAELEEYWQILQEQLHRERELIEEVLVVGRLEAGAVRVQPTAVSLAPILGTAVREASRLAQEKQVELVADYPGELPSVVGDVSGLRTVFAEALDNAVKFTRSGGEVRLEARVVDGGVRICLADTGVGIPADDLPRVFERFVRGANTTGPGSGVGLSLVKVIVEALGGSVQLSSEVGRGTLLEISLVAAVPNAPG
jgi:signal transduction histidine kinase